MAEGNGHEQPREIDADVVRARRFELVDDEGQPLAYIGADEGAGFVGFAVAFERAGERVSVFIGVEEWQPVISFRISGGERPINAAITMVEGKPVLGLQDAEGNEASVYPSPDS